MKFNRSFGTWLKERRQALDLTQHELAEQVACSVVTIRKLERNLARPSKQLAELLAKHLKIPANQRATFVHFARAEESQEAVRWSMAFLPPTNLPMPPMHLIGREAELAALSKRLRQPEARLFTLTGAPGIGKTQLALQAAAQALNEFADGVFFVSLAAITDASLVPTTIASTLGIPDVGPRPPWKNLKPFSVISRCSSCWITLSKSWQQCPLSRISSPSVLGSNCS